MLKHRLLFGIIISVCFVALVLADGYLDRQGPEGAPITANILTALLVITALPAVGELRAMAEAAGVRIFRVPVLIFTLLLATGWYWRQYAANSALFHQYYLLFGSAGCLCTLIFYQALLLGTEKAIVNWSGSFLCCFYLGFLSSFLLGIRIDFGVIGFLMFIFTVKGSDIGAYTIGRMFGRHKFVPRISPGKTWEGVLGACIFALIVSCLFAGFSGIMKIRYAALFGILFGFLGQLGDLVESIIKRDAQKKDSSGNIPGFGGVLDVIDSPVATAWAGYLFFMMTVNNG